MRVLLLAIALLATPAYAETVQIRDFRADTFTMSASGGRPITITLEGGAVFDWWMDGGLGGSEVMTTPRLGPSNNDSDGLGVKTETITVQGPASGTVELDGTGVFAGGSIEVEGETAPFIEESEGIWVAQVPEMVAGTREVLFRVQYPTEWTDDTPLMASDIREAVVYCSGDTDRAFSGGPEQVVAMPYGTWLCEASVVSVDNVESDRTDPIPLVVEADEEEPVVREPRIPGLTAEVL